MVVVVCKCIAYFKPNGNDNPDAGWGGARQMLNKPEDFLHKLVNYGDKIGKVPEKTIRKV
jgi:hypothetical protein